MKIIQYLKYNYSCDGKAEFSALLLKSLVSHGPSEIILRCWFGTQDTFLTICNAEAVKLLNMEAMIQLFSRIHFKKV